MFGFGTSSSASRGILPATRASLRRISIRGDEAVSVLVSSARLYVDAHHTKRFVIALKYEQETDYRDLVASDLSWRTLDIVQAYTLRWLVEVFLEDWKGHEGWGQLTKQPDEEGSSRGLILSLLLDHCLLLHPHQRPAWNTNSLRTPWAAYTQRTQVECLLAFIRDLILTDNPQEQLNRLRGDVRYFVHPRPKIGGPGSRHASSSALPCNPAIPVISSTAGEGEWDPHRR